MRFTRQTIAAAAVALIVLIAALPAYSIDGREIAENVINRDTGETGHSLIDMDLIDAQDNVKNRIIEEWSMENDAGLERLVIVFHRPASVQGTRFLVVENEDRDDDQWIYLPALDRVRRIAASEGDESFMGTDFTYDDLATRDVDEDTHELLREDTFAGREVYVVESVPKDPDDSQYSRRVQWVAKDIWVPLKAEFYDKSDELLKTLTVEELEEVQGIWTPMVSVMENVQSEHATRLEVEKTRYNEDLNADLFSRNFLRTGRAR
ncbi:MAG: outer membrane lipoprotein-sorting protein [Spirochaetaceae bacterium]